MYHTSQNNEISAIGSYNNDQAEQQAQFGLLAVSTGLHVESDECNLE